MENCHSCGRPYEDSFADWTICRECAMNEARERGAVYMDSLGITWTQEELDNAGGIEEVIRLNKEARV